MQPIHAFVQALLEAAWGLLFFRLPMARLPFGPSAREITVSLGAVAILLDAACGNVVLASTLLVVLAVTFVSTQEKHVRQRPKSMKLFALIYVLALSHCVSSTVGLVAEIALPQGASLLQLALSVWLLTAWVMTAPQISQHVVKPAKVFHPDERPVPSERNPEAGTRSLGHQSRSE